MSNITIEVSSDQPTIEVTTAQPTIEVVQGISIAPNSTGDMLAATYDPTNVAGDAFSMDNMVEGATTKILTDTERTKLAGIETAADVTDATNVVAALDGASIPTATVTGTGCCSALAARVPSLQLRHHLLYWPARHELDNHKGQQQDPEQGRDHEQQALEDVGNHGQGAAFCKASRLADVAHQVAVIQLSGW